MKTTRRVEDFVSWQNLECKYAFAVKPNIVNILCD